MPNQSPTERELLIDVQLGNIQDARNKLGEIVVKINELKKGYKALSDQQKQSEVTTGEYTKSINLLNTDKSSLLKTIRELTIAQRQETLNLKAADDSIIGMRGSLAALKDEYIRLGKAAREGIGGTDLLAKISKLNAEVSKAEQSMGVFSRNVGNYKSGFNGLSNSINQVAREMPNFAQSATIGFMALSNNLPILADEIQRVRQANALLVADGKPTVSVFKQIATSIFSWQSALITVISLSVIYAKEIVNFFKGISAASAEAKKSNDEYVKSILEIGRAANDSAIKDKVMMQTYIDTAQNAEAAMSNRIEAVKELQKTYPETFGLLTENAILEGNLTSAIETTTKMLWAKAKAQSAINKGILAEEREAELIDIKNAKIKDYLKTFNSLSDFQKGINDYDPEGLTFYEWLGLGNPDVVNEVVDLDKRIRSARDDAKKFRKEAQVAFETDMPSGQTKDTKKKKDTTKKIKAEEDYQKELLALVEQYHQLRIETMTDKNKQELYNEYEKHHRIIDALKVEAIDNKQIIKQKNLNIEQEQKRHEKEMLRIVLSQGGNKAVDPTVEEAKRFDNATKLLDKKARERYEKKQNTDKEIEDKNRKLAIDAAINAAKQTVDAIAQIKQQELDRQLKRELTAIQRNADGQDRILENRLKNGIISEGQYNDAKQKLNEETAAKELEANRKAFEEKKRLDTATAIANGALAITNILAQVIDPTFTQSLKMIAIAAAVATTATQVAVIQSQKFALGGKVNGKSHAEGGVMIEAEGGEGMINKNSMRSTQVMQAIGTPSQIASAINMSGGGISWETGATLNSPNRNMFNNRSENSTITYSQMAALLNNHANSINSKKVVILESEITKTQNKVKAYETSGRF